MSVSARNQAETSTYLQGLGHVVEPYGQELLSDAARELLRGAPTLDRWLADFLVRTTTAQTLLADAKFSFVRAGNHSIEMRSLLAASREELQTYYVCSTWTGSAFTDFKAILASDVPTVWPCCAECFEQFQSSPDAKVVNKALADYCPATRRSERSSSTPYFVVPGTALLSFDRALLFGAPKPEIWNAPQRRVLDWRAAEHYRSSKKSCVVCGWPTSLRDDHAQPLHKTCAENVETLPAPRVRRVR